MQNTGQDKTQAGVKIAGRSINNLRYANDTTLMAESKEKLRSLVMKVKEQSEKAGLKLKMGLPVAQLIKNPPASAGDSGDASLLPGLGRSPGEGNGNPLQHSCLGNPMDRGAWQATVHGVTKPDIFHREN